MNACTRGHCKLRSTHTPRKRFGQNFLEDPIVVEQIVAAIHPAARRAHGRDRPGLGRTDRAAAAAVGRLDVVEIDRDIVRSLRARFPPEILSIHEGDALELDFAALGADLRVVGNLPYNISTPILFHLTAQRGRDARLPFHAAA